MLRLSDSPGHPKPVDILITEDNSSRNQDSYTKSFNRTGSMIKSSSQFITYDNRQDERFEKFWKNVINSAVYFHGTDALLGEVIAIVYDEPGTSKLSSLIVSKHGQTLNDSLSLSTNSRFYPAIENLPDGQKQSKVRRMLAVSILKTFSTLDKSTVEALYKIAKLPCNSFDWDETQAGSLASSMKLIESRTPQEVGDYLLSLSYTKPLNLFSTNSYVVDTIYVDTSDENLVNKNNALAFLLGEQLEHLFDSLTEYSPEPTEKVYKPPQMDIPMTIDEDDPTVRLICAELITIQTNFTVSLVQFLQKFIVPLRIQVLEGKVPGYNTSRLNQIFPPTIDEVTRINCIFLDMLKLAQPHGSYEILKACGTTIPYFYKAYMRHEAATKNFRSQYQIFCHDIKSIENSNILTYDQRSIETIIYSSLNLVKIQLILNRLMQTKKWPLNLKDNVNLFYDSCNKTITSFASDKLKPYNNRIFTPTGKILAELASGWPIELQYGWLTRRVVAIFDATDILLNSVKNKSVLVVFSDHVLFLNIDDDEYYADLWKNNAKSDNKSIIDINNGFKADDSKIHRPSIPDILMHSLVNETPFTNLPKIKVKSWSKINDINAKHYTKDGKPYVQFFNESDFSKTGIYKLDKVSGKYVVEVLCKAKILNKSQPFHLFKAISQSDKSSIYYTAHESKAYEKEEIKSPFLILFNKQYDEKILQENFLYAFITLNFIKDDLIKIEGISKGHSKFEFEVEITNLTDKLSEKINLLFKEYLTLENPELREYLLNSNEFVIQNGLKVLSNSEKYDALEKEKIIQLVEKLREEREVTKGLKVTKTRSRNSLDLLDTPKKAVFSPNDDKNRISSTKISNDKSDEIKKTKKVLFDKVFGKKKVLHQLQAVKSGSESPRTRFASFFSTNSSKPSVNTAVSTHPMEAKAEKSFLVSNNRIEPKEKKHYRSDTGGNTTSSTSIYVNSHFEFPYKEIDKENFITPFNDEMENKRENIYKGDLQNASDIICAENIDFESSNINPAGKSEDHVKAYSDQSRDHKSGIELKQVEKINYKAQVKNRPIPSLLSPLSSPSPQSPSKSIVFASSTSYKSDLNFATNSSPKSVTFAPESSPKSIRFSSSKQPDRISIANVANCTPSEKQLALLSTPKASSLAKIQMVKSSDAHHSELFPLVQRFSDNTKKKQHLSNSDSYYFQFKQMRAQQESAIQRDSMTVVSDYHLHAKKFFCDDGFLRSPSVYTRLNKLAESIKIEEAHDESLNWISIPSRECTVSKNLVDVGNNEKFENIDEENIEKNIHHEDENESDHSNIHWPIKAKLKSSSIVSVGNVGLLNTLSHHGENFSKLKGKVVGIDERLTEEKHTISGETEDEGSSIYGSNDDVNGLNGHLSSFKSAKSFFNPYNSSKQYQHYSQHSVGIPTVTEENVFNEKDNSDLLACVDLRSLDNDFSLPDLSNLSTETYVTKEEVEKKQQVEFNELTVGDISEFLMDQFSTSPDDNKVFKQPVKGPFDILQRDFTLQELTVGSIDDSNQEISWCSGLINTPQMEALAGDVCISKKGKNLLLDHSTVGLNDLIDDKSYAYLHNFLAGDYVENFILEEEAESMENKEKKCFVQTGNTTLKPSKTDYDLYYSRKLMDSSLNYLAQFIRPDATELQF